VATKKILLDIPFDASAPNAVSELRHQLEVQQDELHLMMQKLSQTQKEITEIQKNCRHQYGFNVRTNWSNVYQCIHCTKMYYDKDDLQTRIAKRP